MKNKVLYNKIEQTKAISALSKGIKAYALELVESAEVELTLYNSKDELLNGASDWSEYSWGGNALIYDGDIVERLCTPSKIKRFKNGKLNKPNAHEEWLDIQATALCQAYLLIRSKLKSMLSGKEEKDVKSKD